MMAGVPPKTAPEQLEALLPWNARITVGDYSAGRRRGVVLKQLTSAECLHKTPLLTS